MQLVTGELSPIVLPKLCRKQLLSVMSYLRKSVLSACVRVRAFYIFTV